MTILASTKDYLVEFEFSLFTISRRTDGHCKALHKQRGIVGTFKKAQKRDGTDAAIDRFLRIATTIGAEWQPLYKPHKMPT